MKLRCRIFGHKRTFTPGQYWSHRYWRWHDCSRASCKRCGTGEPDCFAPGLLDSMKQWWWRWRHTVKRKVSTQDDDIPF